MCIRDRDNVWRSVVDPHLLPYLLANTSAQARRAWASVLGGVGLALVVVALAGPSLHQSKQPLWGTQAPLVIAVDLSSASLTQDLQPNRLAQMRAKRCV